QSFPWPSGRNYDTRNVSVVGAEYFLDASAPPESWELKSHTAPVPSWPLSALVISGTPSSDSRLTTRTFTGPSTVSFDVFIRCAGTLSVPVARFQLGLENSSVTDWEISSRAARSE